MLRAKRVRVASLLVVTLAPMLFGCGLTVSPTAYTCTDGNREERSTIRLVSLDILEKLASGQHQAVWDAAHPALRGASPQAQFLEGAKNVQLRITDMHQAQLRDVKFVRVTSLAASPLQTICGSVDVNSPTHLRVTVPANASIAATSLMDLPGPSIDRTANCCSLRIRGTFD